MITRNALLICVPLLVGSNPPAVLSQPSEELVSGQPPQATLHQAEATDPTVHPRGRRIALDDALTLFERHNLDLRIAREEVVAARARAVSAGAFSNPVFAAAREQLADGDESYDETMLSLGQTLEIAGQRGLRRDAARRAADAALARLAAVRLRLGFEVRRVFVHAAAAESRLAAIGHAAEVVRLVERAGQARFVEGDISDFARLRLQLERARYEDLLVRARLDLTQAGRDLALLVSPDSLAPDGLLPLETLDSLTVPIPGAAQDTAPPAAAEHPEVRAARAEVEAASKRLELAGRERIPDITVTGGYKEQADGFRGAVIGLSVPLPLLDRNTGRVQEARADLATAEARRALMFRRTEADIRGAWETYRSLAQRIEGIDEDLLADTAGLLEIARLAYAEGEMTLVELLDAAEAYRASQDLAIDLIARHLIAIYDLERATGGALTDPTTSSSEDQQ